MRISTISDVHVKKSGDEASELLMSFMSNKNVLDSDYIFFLGDIFDFMYGGHNEYLHKHNDFFSKLTEILRAGKHVIYMEGNHDFYNKKLFDEFIKKHNLSESNFEYISGEYILNINGKQVQFSHGDDIEVDNPAYKRYKKFVTSRFFKFITDIFLSFKRGEKMGANASNKSRKNGEKYFKEDHNRERFRKSAKIQAFKYDVIICGHSHIQEDYKFDLNNRSCHYLNNGFIPKDQMFIHFDSENWNLRKIESD